MLSKRASCYQLNSVDVKVITVNTKYGCIYLKWLSVRINIMSRARE